MNITLQEASWNNREIADASRLLATSCAHHPVPARTHDRGLGTCHLSLNTGRELSKGLAFPNNGGPMLVRQILKALHFNERRLFTFRFEHKLVQALLLSRYCPSDLPFTTGFNRYMVTPGVRPISDIAFKQNFVIKPALGYGSGESWTGVSTDEALIETAAARLNSGSLSCLSEQYIVQQRVPIVREYRVHTIEDEVIPDLTYLRYHPHRTGTAERDAPNSFVQGLLQKLPDELVADSFYGWDVAVDANGKHQVIEVNVSGVHLEHLPGFQCSGFFHAARWKVQCLAELISFVEKKYDVSLPFGDIELSFGDDAAMTYALTGFYCAHRKLFSHVVHKYNIDKVANSADALLSAYPFLDTSLSATLADLSSIVPRNCIAANTVEPLIRHERGYPWGARPLDPQDNPETIISLFSAQTAKTPHAVAVNDGTDLLTYRELDILSDQIATCIKEAGHRVGDAVVLCMNRSVNLLGGLLAIFKAGGIYVPVDGGHPRERIDQVVRRSAATAILTDADHAASFDAFNIPRLLIEEIDQEAPVVAIREHVSVLDIAYILFTSGTTGVPKGVAVPHEALINIVVFMGEYLGCDTSDSWLAMTTVAFDISIIELLVPLVCGGQVVLASDFERHNLRSLIIKIANVAPTIMQCTPTGWKLLLEAGWQGKSDMVALCGGEALDADLAVRLGSRVAHLINLYGPTETTIWSTIWRWSRPDRPIVLGVPVANTEIYLLDSQLNQVAEVGDIGEIYIAGRGLARGYLDDPVETAGRFVANPVSTRWSRMYRTGDMARVVEGGNFAFVGRNDDQVKINGNRVELSEIEVALRVHPDISDAAVIAVEGNAGEIKLVGFVVPKAEIEINTNAVRDYLTHILPQYMIPSQLFSIGEIPRTANNKRDRAALKAAYKAGKRDYNAWQSSEVVNQLQELWKEVLNIDFIDPGATFIELGGDSLAVMRCINKIMHYFNYDVSLEFFYSRDATLATLARILAERHRSH